MSVEFIGFLHYQESSESLAPSGAVVQPEFVKAFAQAQDQGGFDKALIAYHSSTGDGFLVAQYAAAFTERLGLLVAHRPGFVAPTVAARKFATLDQLSKGRASVNINSGGDDAEQRRDGDYLSHDERYERTGEFIDILKQTWTSEEPFSHEGKYYRFEDNVSSVRPVQKPHIPVFFSGSSDAAVKVGARTADTYMLWAESLAGTREQIARISAAAAQFNRPQKLRFSLSVRPIIAPTEAEAWAKAESILEKAKALRAQGGAVFGRRGRTGAPRNVGSLRLLETAAQGKVVDKRLWTEIAALTGAGGNSTALVGTPEQVAEALLDYYDLGIETILVRGFNPLADAIDYGRELIPLVRQEVARRDAEIKPSAVAAA
ncbi:MAG: LLM class flavin-dependent oxidoreductase [Caulobacteraceae bacterium]|nr:LLM class flavin-dependent oxidoreductase [Caulobacteraceae bacterium]